VLLSEEWDRFCLPGANSGPETIAATWTPKTLIPACIQIEGNLVFRKRFERRSGAAWLELILLLAIVVLSIQLMPLLWPILDVRNWSRTAWFAANIVVLLALLATWYLPNLIEDFAKRLSHISAGRAKAEKSRATKERQKAIRSAIESRQRRLY